MITNEERAALKNAVIATVKDTVDYCESRRIPEQWQKLFSMVVSGIAIGFVCGKHKHCDDNIAHEHNETMSLLHDVADDILRKK